MAKVAVVFHSGYGHTLRMAQSVAAGAGAELVAIDADGNLPEGGWETLASADAIIFGSPTYMGSATAKFHEFMESTSKIWYGRGWKDKLAAGFTISASQSGDKLNTLVQMAVFAAQHGMLWVGNDLLPGNNNSKGSVEDLNRLGSFLGAMAQANADEGPEVAPPHSDRKTAERLGERVAEAAARWLRGK